MNVSLNTLNPVGKAKNKLNNQEQILYKAFSPKLIQINCNNERKQVRYSNKNSTDISRQKTGNSNKNRIIKSEEKTNRDIEIFSDTNSLSNETVKNQKPQKQMKNFDYRI